MPEPMDRRLCFGRRPKMYLFVLAALIGLAFGGVDYTGHQVYRVHPKKYQLHIIKKIGERFKLDFWHEPKFPEDNADFRVSPGERKKINTFLYLNRIQYDVLIEDVQYAIDQQNSPRPADISFATFGHARYHDFGEIDRWITGFAALNSHLVSAVDVGTGKSLEGRNMRALKISTGENRKAFVINCGIHAREWVSPATCIYTARRLVRSYKLDSNIAGLMDSVDFYLIPVSNPDGYEYSHKQDRMWRKTRSTPESNKCPEGCYGVDPNRNFDIHWGDGGISSSCCSSTFSGTEAFSEIETQNQRDFVKKINPSAYIDIHSYSQLWMYPYGWTNALPPDDDFYLLSEIGQASVAAIKSVNQRTYVTGTIANTIYQVFGSTTDYFYDQGIVCSFAAELRDTGKWGFLLPTDQIIPTGAETFAGLMTIAKYVKEGDC